MKKQHSYHRNLVTSASVLALFWSSGAIAQIDEIIVTAQKREQRIQDIPASVQAYDAERLAISQLSDVEDVQFLSPGLNIGSYLTTPLITARGIGNDSLSPIADPGVAVHLDGVYLGRRALQTGIFYDLERLEVLKGPQGSLYGRNATGGAVNLVPKSPTDELDAGFTVRFGTFNEMDAEGFVSGPLNDSGATRARLVAYRNEHNGYTPNVFNGIDHDDQDAYGGRLKIAHDLGSALSIEITADYNREETIPGVLSGRSTPGGVTLGEFLGGTIPSGRRVSYDAPTEALIESWGVNVLVELDLNDIQVTSRSAFRDLTTDVLLDLDATEAAGVTTDTRTDIKQYTQDLYAVGDHNRFSWIVGASALRESGSSGVEFVNFAVPIGLNLLLPDIKTTSLAVFGEASVRFLDKLELTVGGRFSYDEKEVDEIFSIPGVLSVPSSQSDNWSSFTPRASLVYDVTDDISTYFTVGTGFKSGTFNTFQVPPTPPVEQEEVINYEIGLKSVLFNQTTLLNISAFYMDYTELQVTQATDTGAFIENAADATIKGVEVDMSWRSEFGLGSDVGLSYLDAEYDDFFSRDVALNGPLSAPVDVSGNQMTSVPTWSLNLGVQYQQPVSDLLSILARVDYHYQTEVFFRAFNDNLTRQPGYSWLNATLNFDVGDQWRVQLFGKNLTDEFVTGHQFLSDAALGNIRYVIPLQPQTYGIGITFRFNPDA